MPGKESDLQLRSPFLSGIRMGHGTPLASSYSRNREGKYFQTRRHDSSHFHPPRERELMERELRRDENRRDTTRQPSQEARNLSPKPTLTDRIEYAARSFSREETGKTARNLKRRKKLFLLPQLISSCTDKLSLRRKSATD